MAFICFNFLYGCESQNTKIEEPAKVESNYYNKYNTRCIDTLISHTGKQVPGFTSEKAFGPPKGAGQYAGSLDVFVIGDGKEAIFEIKGYSLTNSSGNDLKVFENGFEFINDSMSWDLGTFEVSPDNVNWYGFEPKDNPKRNMVGLKPVIVNFEENNIDPRNNEAGGDAFDLSNAKLIVDKSTGNPFTYTYGKPLTEAVRYFKIVDGGIAIPDGQVESNGVDVDALCVFYSKGN